MAVTNLDPTAVRVELGAAGAMQAAGETLAAPKVDSVNTFESPGTVAPKSFVERSSGGKVVLKLMPHSVTVVVLES